MSNIENLLDIIIITENSEKEIEKLLFNILSDSSIIRNCNITIVDNNSLDNTRNIVENLTSKYNNIKLIHNKRNIGKAIYIKSLEIAEKNYFLILDSKVNINLDFLKSIKDIILSLKYDVITLTSSISMEDERLKKCIKDKMNKNNVKFLKYILENLDYSNSIYKKDIISNTLLLNSYAVLYTGFPHSPLLTHNINNNNNNIYFSDKSIIDNVNKYDNTHELKLYFLISLLGIQNKYIYNSLKRYLQVYKVKNNIEKFYPFIYTVLSNNLSKFKYFCKNKYLVGMLLKMKKMY